MARTYYAAQSPRGFANEINVYSFSSLARRDAWVAQHADDGDVNAAYLGAYAVTAREARKIAGPMWDGMGPIKGSVYATHID